MTVTVPVERGCLICEEKRLTGWKQGHTPERRFGAPAFGGGFFLPRVIHRPSGATNSFKLQNASKALLLVLQGIKKTRCDAHIGPGDGGTDNMAQLLATA